MVLGIDSKLDSIKIMPNLLDINSNQPQTGFFPFHFCLDFASCSVVLSGWMEGPSLLPTWPGGEVGGFPMGFPRWLLLGRGEVNPRCFNTFDWKELETWIKQEIMAAQSFEAIDVWVFWDVEMLGLLYFVPVFHFAWLMRNDGSNSGKETKVAMEV